VFSPRPISSTGRDELLDSVVSKTTKDTLHARLKLPVSALTKDKIVIARRIGQRWRLVGYGTVL